MFLGSAWIWWLFGSFGAAGIIVPLVMAPAIAVPIIQGLAKFLFGTRPGWALIAAVLAFMAADIWRTRQFDQEKAEFKQAQIDLAKQIATETRADVWKEIANATSENTVIDTDVKEFKDALPPVPHVGDSNPFRIGHDAARLCRISGFAECGRRERAQGVRKAVGKRR